jgi:antitoxin component YwqK of YwqJK toxin-antitoxin module
MGSLASSLHYFHVHYYNFSVKSKNKMLKKNKKHFFRETTRIPLFEFPAEIIMLIISFMDIVTYINFTRSCKYIYNNYYNSNDCEKIKEKSMIRVINGKLYRTNEDYDLDISIDVAKLDVLYYRSIYTDVWWVLPTLKEGQYIKHGPEKCWHLDKIDGNIPMTRLFGSRQFLNGKQNGQTIQWYRHGKIMSQTNYLNGKKEGTMVTYHLNGDVSSTIEFSNGKKNGKYIIYNYEDYPSNIPDETYHIYRLQSFQTFKNDELHGISFKRLHENHKMIFLITSYENGQKKFQDSFEQDYDIYNVIEVDEVIKRIFTTENDKYDLL